MITAHLQGDLLRSGEAFCTICLKEALPTDEVLLHIWQPRPTASHGFLLLDLDEAEKEAASHHEIFTIAYDEQRQQHIWRGTVPAGRLLVIVVAHGCEGIGLATVEFEGGRFTWYNELQRGINLRVNQSEGFARSRLSSGKAGPTAHEAIEGTLYAAVGQGISLYVFRLGTRQTDRVCPLASALTTEALWHIRQAQLRASATGKTDGYYAIREGRYWCACLLSAQEVLHLSVEREGRVIGWISVDWAQAQPEIRPILGIALDVEPLPRSLLDLLANQPDELDDYLPVISRLCEQGTRSDPAPDASGPDLLEALFTRAARHYQLLLERCSTAQLLGQGWPRVGGSGTPLAAASSGRSAVRDAAPIVCFPELPSSAFFGRESLLDALHADFAYAIEGRWFNPLMLSGIGGAGKTRTALEYARRYRGDYTHLFWADASQPSRLAAAFEEFAVAMEIPARERAGENRLVESVWAWLQAHERWLLVFDGAAEMIEHGGVGWTGKRFFAAHPYPRGHVLVTTRSTALYTRVPHLRRYVVGDLPEHEAMRLLLHRAGLISLRATGAATELLIQEKLPEEECSALFALLDAGGGLPLLLDQLGAYLAESHSSPSHALQEFTRDPLALLGRRGGHGGEHPASVMQALLQDIAALYARRPHAATLLKAWAFLGAAPLPEAVLQVGGNWLLDTLHPGKIWDVQRILAFDLDCFSFFARDLEMRTYTLHQLVSCLVQATMAADEHSDWTARAVQVVSYTLEHPSSLYASSSQGQRLRPLVQHCLRLIEGTVLDSLELSRIRSSFLRLLYEWG